MKHKTIKRLVLLTVILLFNHKTHYAQSNAEQLDEVNIVINDSAARYVLENLDRALFEKETIYHRFKGYQMQIDWCFRAFNKSVKRIEDEYKLNRDYNKGIEDYKKDTSKLHHVLNTIDELQVLVKTRRNQISEHMLSYLPTMEGMDVIVNIVVFTSINGTSDGYNNIMLRIDWDNDAEPILNGIVHEAYHTRFETQKLNYSNYTIPAPTTKKMFFNKMYMDIQNEGMATLVAYNTRNFLSIKRSTNKIKLPDYDYYLLESDSCVKRAFMQINQIIESSPTLTVDSLNRLEWEIGTTERAYYITGAYMSKAIEEKYGRKHLVDLVFKKNEADYINEYNALVEDEYKMKIIEY